MPSLESFLTWLVRSSSHQQAVASVSTCCWTRERLVAYGKGPFNRVKAAMTMQQGSLSQHRRSSLMPRAAVVVACLLVVIRVVAGFVCHTCFVDFEQPTSRSFHLHAGGDRDPCHHGQAEASPLTTWACTVTQDETAFILPEVPRLPLVVSAFVLLVLLLMSYRTLFEIAAHGRGPPVVLS